MKIALTVPKTAVIGALSAFALVLPSVSFASEADYGAGFWPSPSAPEFTTTQINVQQGNYGAAFAGAPVISHATTPNKQASSQKNYGAAFAGAPKFSTKTTDNKANKDNYGAAFTGPADFSASTIPSDAVKGSYGAAFNGAPDFNAGSTGSIAYMGNYGAAFTASPNIVNTFTFRPNPANYGAGFRTYGIPWSWSGAGYRIYSLGWWL